MPPPLPRFDSAVEAVADANTAAPELDGLPCEVAKVVRDKCGTCHGSDPSAPMSLVSAADFQKLSSQGEILYATSKQKINAADPRGAMPPVSAKALTAEERALLTAWLEEGAPGAASATCVEDDAGVLPDSGEPLWPGDDELDCYRLLAHNGDGVTPFNVGVQLDGYIGFTFAAPWKETAYAVAIRSIVDNKKVLHHWQLLQDVVPGTPGGGVLQTGLHTTGQLIAVWAPGADDTDFRRSGHSVGLELPANTTYMIEFHYNSGDFDAKDQSGAEVCVAKTKPTNSAGWSWLGADNIAVPSDHWTGTCKPTSSEPIQIVALMPHMHIKGIYMKGTLNRKDGSKEIIHDAPFDFNFQKTYPAELTVYPGDSITTECTFSEPALLGKATNQEMCYLFALAYPQYQLVSPDIWGLAAHGPSSCIGF